MIRLTVSGLEEGECPPRLWLEGGRNTEKWTLRIYVELVDEFERHSSSRMKFSPKILRIVARKLLSDLQADSCVEHCNPKGTPLDNLVSGFKCLWRSIALLAGDNVGS